AGKAGFTSDLKKYNFRLIHDLIGTRTGLCRYRPPVSCGCSIVRTQSRGTSALSFLGHLYTPAYAEKYVQGKYVFNDERLTLYVNSGIGTTRLPYRFLCKPEIHVFTLKSD